MNEQNFSELVNLFREIHGRITYTETELSPAELTDRFIWSNIDNTGEIWQSLFLLADHVKSLTELYDNDENGFFLSLSDTKKEEIYKDMIFIMNSHLEMYVRLEAAAPLSRNNSVFFGIEENMELMARVKQFLISKNLYTG
jgi:hypothetical protein